MDSTVGPVRLHFDNKVMSVGSDESCQMQITGDPEIDGEHGMISFTEDKLMYVNSSGKETTIDDVAVDPDGGPVDLNNGVTLAIGGTKLLMTSYTEFDPAA